MSIPVVQQKATGFGTTSATASYGSVPPVGRRLLCLCYGASAAPVMSNSGWTAEGPTPTIVTNGRINAFWKTADGSSDQSVTVTTASGAIHIQIFDISGAGLDGANAFHKSVGVNDSGTNVTSQTSGTLAGPDTPTLNDCLSIAFFGHSATTTGTHTYTNSFATLSNDSNNSRLTSASRDEPTAVNVETTNSWSTGVKAAGMVILIPPSVVGRISKKDPMQTLIAM